MSGLCLLPDSLPKGGGWSLVQLHTESHYGYGLHEDFPSEGDVEALKEVLEKQQPIRFLPLKFCGLQIAAHATTPDSPSPFR